MGRTDATAVTTAAALVVGVALGIALGRTTNDEGVTPRSPRPGLTARPPTLDERAAIMAALPAFDRAVPVECFWPKVLVSSRDRRYASVGGAFLNWQGPRSRCLRYTHNAGYVLKKDGRWKVVFTGTTDPSCRLGIPRDLIGCRRP